MAIERLLPGKMTAVPAWTELASAIEELMADNIWAPVQAVSQLRDPQLVEKEFLSLVGALLGFDLKSDLFQEADYRRLIAELAKYYEKSGTNSLADFIGYSRNTGVQIIPQWTRDYNDFFDAPGGSTIYEGGEWYLTPHVTMKYDAEKSGQIPLQTAKDLFYNLAPVHLVLERIVASLYGAVPFYVAMAAIMTVRYPVESTEVNLNFSVHGPMVIRL